LQPCRRVLKHIKKKTKPPNAAQQVIIAKPCDITPANSATPLNKVVSSYCKNWQDTSYDAVRLLRERISDKNEVKSTKVKEGKMGSEGEAHKTICHITP